MSLFDQVAEKTLSTDVYDNLDFDISALSSLALYDEHIGLKVDAEHSRAELSCDVPHAEHDTMIYSWGFLVPESFENDAQKRWCIVAQWHHQPEPGQTWQDMPGELKTASPPVLVGIGEHEGQTVLSVTYKDQEPKGIPFAKGRAYRMTAAIKWARDDSGALEITVADAATNDKQKLCFEGPNMLNNSNHYFKAGIYRDPAIQAENEVYISALNVVRM